MKSKSLQDLDAMRKKLADIAKAQALAEQARIAEAKRTEAERNLFTRAVGKVAPIANQERVWSPPQRPSTRPLQQDLDDEAVMHESMSDEFDISTLLDVDDQLSFRRPGIGTDVTRKLRKGEWSIPGGTQELGETVRETAMREIMEETGLSIANLRLIDVVDAFGKHPDGTLRTQWVLIDFRADWVAGQPTAGSDAAHAEWMTLERIRSLALWPETLRIIETALAMP